MRILIAAVGFVVMAGCGSGGSGGSGSGGSDVQEQAKNCETWAVLCQYEDHTDIYQMCQECWPDGACAGKAAENFPVVQCAIEHDYCPKGSGDHTPPDGTATVERCDAVRACAAQSNVPLDCN